MGVKNISFYLDLKTLSSKGNDKLKEFAKSEELDVEDIIKIIYSEAKKIGEEGKVKVTFKMLDDEDSFKVIVESVTMKYKGTVIYPYNLVKSMDFEYSLDPVLGKITLYNKKEECKKISVTIDGVALDIFSMTYSKAKNFLKEISDRKNKNGYIEFPDAICFKVFGVKLNAKKEENGDISVDAPVLSIDVYNEEEFFKEFYFEEEVEKEEEKYDVNIPLPDEYNYEKKESKRVASTPKVKNVEIELPKEEKKQEETTSKVEEIQIEIPIEQVNVDNKEQNKQEVKIEENNIDDADAELDRIRKRQDEELEKVKEKLRIELEQQLQNNLKKYDEDNEKRVSQTQDVVEEEIESTVVPIEVKEEPKQEEIKPQEKESIDEQQEEKDPKEDKTQDEIKELERLLEEEKKQQEILENRILKKLEELKEASVKKEKTKVEPSVKNVKKNHKPQVENKMKSYTIESYKGIKENDKKDLAIFFGEDKTLIRNYLGNPKEQREDEDMEIYDTFFVYYNEENKCTGMGIYNQESYKDKLELKLFDQNLITMKYIDIVKLIKAHDYSAIEDEDGIISLKYGISIDPKDTSNYKEELCDVIYIFKKEYYNV